MPTSHGRIPEGVIALSLIAGIAPTRETTGQQLTIAIEEQLTERLTLSVLHRLAGTRHYGQQSNRALPGAPHRSRHVSAQPMPVLPCWSLSFCSKAAASR